MRKWVRAEREGGRRGRAEAAACALQIWTARARVHRGGSVWLTRVLRDRTMEDSLNVYAKGNPLARHCTESGVRASRACVACASRACARMART